MIIKKFLEENLLKAISIPLILTFIGVVIFNIYLEQYSISNYNIFQPRALFTGTAFLLICLSFLIFALLFLNTDDVSSNSLKWIFFNFLFKTLIMSSAFYSLFVANQNNCDYQWGKVSLSSNTVKSLSIFSLLMSFTVLLNWQFFKKPKQGFDINKWAAIFAIATAIIFSFIAFVFLFKYEPEFRSVLYFFSLLASLFFSFYFGLWASNRDHARKIETKGGVFSSTLDKTGFDMLFYYCYLTLMLLAIIFKYSRDVYPLISRLQGGAKEAEAIVCSKNEKEYHGRIINDDGNQIFILDSSQNVFIIQYNDIDYLYRVKQNQ
jgi:hypothetical protein